MESPSLGMDRRGGNWWYEQALQLPSTPEVTAHMSDVEAFDAVLGQWAPVDVADCINRRLCIKPQVGHRSSFSTGM